MSTASWRSLEKPLDNTILGVIENDFKFEKMTPVQVDLIKVAAQNCMFQ